MIGLHFLSFCFYDFICSSRTDKTLKQIVLQVTFCWTIAVWDFVGLEIWIILGIWKARKGVEMNYRAGVKQK